MATQRDATAETLGLAASFLLLSLSLLAFHAQAAAEASLSLYTPHPAPWALLVLGLLAAIPATLWGSRRLRVLGLVAVAGGAALTVAAPYLLGVVAPFPSDPLAHLRRYKTILVTGHVDEHGYFGLDVLLLTVVHAAGIRPETAVAAAPAVSKVLSLVFYVYLVTRLTDDATTRALAVAPWAGLFLGESFEATLYPELVALHYTAFVLAMPAAAPDGIRPRRALVVLLAGVGAVLLHTRMGSYALLALVGVLVASRAVRRRPPRTPVGLAGGLIVAWLAWALTVRQSRGVVGSISSTLFGEGLVLSPNTLKAVDLGLADLARFFVAAHSPLLLVAAASAVGLWALRSRGATSTTWLTLAALGGVGLLGVASALFVGLQSLSRAAAASPLALLGVVLAYAAWTRTDRWRVPVAVLLVLATVASPLTTYRSPATYQSSWHVGEPTRALLGWAVDRADGEALSVGVTNQTNVLVDPGPGRVGGSAGLALVSTGGYPSSLAGPAWLEGTTYVVVHDRVTAWCADVDLRERLVPGKPPLHRPAFCPFLASGALETTAVAYDNGPLRLHVNPAAEAPGQ